MSKQILGHQVIVKRPFYMRTTKDSKLTIRLTKDEKTKLENEAKKLKLDTSKFIREFFIKLIND